jgi:N-glycosylase/DNA lyase
MQITIPAPPQFSFKRTVLSHGWCTLAPFELDKENWLLSRVIDPGDAAAVRVTISNAPGGVSVTAAGRSSKRAIAKVVRDVRHMLRFDDDMSQFYELVSRDPEFEWIVAAGAGRMLRSPTLFEDLVKTICTTNCSWALTDKMVTALVELLGKRAGNGAAAFPTPEAMATQTERFYRDEVRAGYRAPYFKELAERVAGGEIDVEAWGTMDLPTSELVRVMKGVKGVGDYAAENMLRFLGRYDGMAFDSWVRAEFARTRNNGRKASDKKIERYYTKFGAWRGLVFWCDMTRDWLEAEARATW